MEPDPCARFLAALTYQGVSRWLRSGTGHLLDLSAGPETFAELAADLGYQVILRADPSDVADLPSECVDAVLAEGGALSGCLATEETLAVIAGLLRPAGRVLLSVDSLVGGLAQLAVQRRWAELADSPAADVLLVGGPPDAVRRCFSPADLRQAMEAAGLEVEWIRPRPVLPTATIEEVLTGHPEIFEKLLRTEFLLEETPVGDEVGLTLVAAGHRREAPLGRARAPLSRA